MSDSETPKRLQRRTRETDLTIEPTTIESLLQSGVDLSKTYVSSLTDFDITNFPQNVRFAQEMATARMWRNGSVLRVRFENGTRLQRFIVKHHVRKSWEAFANIRFEFVGRNAEEAEITVQFGSEGNHSQMGTDTLLCSYDRATMNLDFKAGDGSLDNVKNSVLHEFSHALGLHHEHQRGCSRLRLNIANLKTYWAGNGIERWDWKLSKPVIFAIPLFPP
jgi:hypothetical protein